MQFFHEAHGGLARRFPLVFAVGVDEDIAIDLDFFLRFCIERISHAAAQIVIEHLEIFGVLLFRLAVRFRAVR